MTTAKEDQIANLEQLRSRWGRTGIEPSETGVLSSGEYRALVMASGRDNTLSSPILDFLLLDGNMQRWVLETWGKQSLIGQKIGE